MKKVVIFGVTGAIGMALAKKCIDEGIAVVALVREGSNRRNRLPESELLQVVDCDLNGIEKLSEDCIQSIGECDVFYHFAWSGTIGDGRNNMALQIDNVKHTLEAVELASRLGCKTFIGAGSQAEYGRVEGSISADTAVNPENGYGIAKLCAGSMSRIRCEQLGLTHIWTRILSVYGPYDGEMTMVISTIRKLLNGERPSFTAGEQNWDYLYSGDAAKAMYLLGINSLSDKAGRMNGRIYPIGSGEARPLKEYIKIMRDAIDTTLELGLGDIPYGPKQVMNLVADISNLRADTGFEPEVDFETGIRETIDWCRGN